MIKPLLVAALYVLAHDVQHLSDWIGESKLKDPYTNDLCCGIRDCHPVKFGGVLETSDGYYVVELQKLVRSSRVIWRSPDGHWWLCTQWFDSEDANDGGVFLGLRCLIGPSPNS